MPLGRKFPRIQVLVDGTEVELRTPEGERLDNVRQAVINLDAGEIPTIDLTFVMPSVNADVKVGTCWMVCPICGDQVMHNCGEEDDGETHVYRPVGTARVGGSVIVTGGGSTPFTAGGGTGGTSSSNITFGTGTTGSAGPAGPTGP